MVTSSIAASFKRIDDGTDASTKLSMVSYPIFFSMCCSSASFGPICLSENVSRGLKRDFFAAVARRRVQFLWRRVELRKLPRVERRQDRVDDHITRGVLRTCWLEDKERRG